MLRILPIALLAFLMPMSVDGAWIVQPQSVELSNRFDQTQLIVREQNTDGQIDDRSADGTSIAKYESLNETIVNVDERGRVFPVMDGTTQLRIQIANETLIIPVTVSGMMEETTIKFVKDVAPILSKSGCNMGACHASQYGKGGFKLSVFGFEPSADHEMIVRDRRQRRVNLLKPEESLFLQKPTMTVPHGGAKRLQKGSPDYNLLLSWLEQGAVVPEKEPAKVTKLEVIPNRRVTKPETSQQLRVIATYQDETQRDVTAWSRFDSMDEGVLSVNEDGRVDVLKRGQAPIMVRFEGQAEIAMFAVPYQEQVPLAGWQNQNFVDEHASAKFRELGIEPSPLCDNPTFLRRAFLDATGSIPSATETDAFLQDTDPKKREKLIDRLLGLTGDANLDIYNDHYASYWTLKWADLVRNNSNDVGDQGMWAFHNWLRNSFLNNKPFDQFVSEIVTAKGSIYSNGPANYFRINSNSSELAESTAQIFLGVRIQCAQCHHHPFEKYSQADYYSFAAFFSRIGTKNSQEFGLFGRETVVLVRNSGEVRHPKTGKNLPPKPLGGEPVDSELDRRIPLAEWLTSKENRLFPQSIVNRYTSYLLGRGLVEPIDDMRATNPPTNVAMMEALTDQFIESDFDVKQLIRTIMTSRLYQLSSQPTPENVADTKFYSHYLVKRIPAEPLLDAIDQVTGDATKFQNLPPGTRAIDLPDAEYPNYFLNTFAKPRRVSVCECERMPDENLSQALHTLNGDVLTNKIASTKGLVAELLKAKKENEQMQNSELVEKIYLASLSRYPTSEEQAAVEGFLKEYPTEKECFEDLMWALINSKDFLFVH
ncbi:DUF1549 domain-containing protein [Planctomycetaceae bacterium]|nr:DUF1549 domain-containing protein [bacterium]MDC0273571.1 DUF1549 domain-containing protein [Planctomycetaceae bacterium]